MHAASFEVGKPLLNARDGLVTIAEGKHCLQQQVVLRGVTAGSEPFLHQSAQLGRKWIRHDILPKKC